MFEWTARFFSRDEAAGVCGMPRGSLDSLIHRARDAAVLFCEKRGSRRWFSPKDITVLRVAYDLERGGMSWLMAIGQAFDNLERPPPPDALLVGPVVIKRGCGLPRMIADRDVPRQQFEVSTFICPIGKIAADVQSRCATLGAADVAVHD